MDFIIQNFNEFLTFTGFANASAGNLIMILVGALFIWLAIKKDFEPLLLVPIGLGIILGNIPFRADAGLEIGLYEDNSVLNIFYQGVKQGWYPPLVFLGIGAMTDFSALISNPKLILIGAAAQFGIFGAYSRQNFLHSLVLDSFCLLQGLGIDCLSLVIVLRKQIKLQELIRPLSTFVSVEINRLCAIRQILIAYAHRFIVTSHVTLLFILLIVILRDLLLTVQRYEK